MSTTRNATDAGFPGLPIALILLGFGGGVTWLAAQPCKCPGNPSTDPVAIVVIPAIFGALVLFFLVLPGALRITWDDSGLRYGFLGNKHVPWSAITDYGIRVVRSSALRETKSYVICLSSGKEIVSFAAWNHHEAFQQAVRGKATAARTRQWSELGLRSIDTEPLVFKYNVRAARGAMILIPIVATLPMTPFVVMLVQAAMRGFSPVGWQWELAAFLVMLLFVVSCSGGLSLMCGLINRDVVRRGGEFLAVTPDTIQFTSGGETQIRSWEEVSDYYTERLPGIYDRVYTIRFGDTGTMFRFTPRIERFGQLIHLIEKRTRLQEQPWRDIGAKTQAGIPVADWKKGDSGTQVYHYRTLTNRLMVILVTGGLLCLPLSPLLDIYLNDAAPSKYQGFLMCAILFAPMILLTWWYYLTSRLETDDKGITQYVFHRRKHLDWSEVAEWKIEGSRLVIKGRSGTKLAASLESSEGEILPFEIEQRTGLSQSG